MNIMNTMKTPHGTARALRRKNIGRFRDAQADRAALLRASTISYNLAPRRPGTRLPPQTRVFGLVRDGAFTSVREYEVNSDHPAGHPCDCRPQVCSHGRFEHRKALDWLRAREA